MSSLKIIQPWLPNAAGLPQRRFWNGFGFLMCAGCLGFAFFAQFYLGLQPCPLCILQRLVLAVLAGVFLIAALQQPSDWIARGYSIIIGLVAGLGAAIAARHVWLQHLPPEEAPRCGPGLNYLLETLPLSDLVREVLTGSGECAEVGWTLLGLSMPAWSLLTFLGVGVWGVVNNWRRRVPSLTV
ncbi:MAG: disulfide bond formation protein B [Candidatus Contendobacter sp.]